VLMGEALRLAMAGADPRAVAVFER
jgi:hypothetical protein